MYVWIDALTNYLTSIGFPDENANEYTNFWKDTQGREAVHVVGKDILRFHAVYWPAFLMAAEIALPDRIIAHGWWTIEGEKMSKSIGNVIAPVELVENYGLDQTRYFLLKAMPFGNDGDLSKERLVEVCNADLALDQLAVPNGERNFENLTKDFKLKFGTDLPTPQGIFPRLEVKDFGDVQEI